MATADRTSSWGMARLSGLLSPEAATRAETARAAAAGYLDLLGDDLESTGTVQDLMTTRFVPSIYERYWRPALARAVKGVTGPGMAEEVRIARLLLGLGPGDVVLDVACGPGNFTREFARAVGEEGLAVGIDASTTMLTRGVAEMRAAEPGEHGPDPRQRRRAAVSRRRLRRDLDASPLCTCSPIRSRRWTRCAGSCDRVEGSRS